MKFKIEEFIRQRREKGKFGPGRYICNKKMVTDHEGRVFESIIQFCDFYGISRGKFSYWCNWKGMDAAQISLMVLRRRKNEKH